MSSVDVHPPKILPIKPPERSGIAERLLALPLVNLAVYLYDISKRKSPFLHAIFSRGERVFFHVTQRATDLTCDLKNRFYVTRSEFVSTSILKVKNQFTKVIMSSKKLMRRGKRAMIGAVEHKTRFILRSLPGRVVMWSVDCACGVAETVLFIVRPGLRKVRNAEIMKNGMNGAHTVTTKEHLENSEKDREDGILVILTKPLELLVYLMRGVQRYLHGIADVNRRHSKKNGSMSPDKLSEIKSRRKVSPRKKIKTGLINQLERTVNYFGLTNLVPGLRRKFNIDISSCSKGQLRTSPNKAEDDDKKRKYEDILSESESDSDNDLQTLDLDQYVSDEDPDFKPGKGETTDSEEYRDGDTESDIEFETTVEGTTQVKVQTKSASKENIAPSSKEEKKSEPKDHATSTKPDDKGKPTTTKVVDSSLTKEQNKTSPLETTMLSIKTSPKSNTKSSVLKSSTPKPNSGKENAAPQESKTNAGSKKSTEPKHGPTENADKKSDPKNSSVANGDKKPETKIPTTGCKKVTNGGKK